MQANAPCAAKIETSEKTKAFIAICLSKGKNGEMNWGQLCRMRYVKSIFLACLVPVSGLHADALTPCPVPKISYSCNGGSPALEMTRAARGQALDLRLGAAHASGPLGDALLTLPAQASSNSLPLQNLPQAAQSLVIVGQGIGDDEACCISTVSLPAPPADLCKSPVEKSSEASNTDSPDTPVKDTKEDTPAPDAFDLALKLELQPDCPEGAALHRCTGRLTISVTGTPKGIIPITLETSPSEGIQTHLGGPLQCHDGGAGLQLCRGEAAVFGDGLSLPLALQAGWSYNKRQVEVCATLAAPETPGALITLVQTALTALGYDVGGIDGQSGPRTRAAVAELTERFGLQIDDPLHPDLLTLLGLGPFSDEAAENNRACARTYLPPRARPKPVVKPSKPRLSTPAPQKPDIIYDPPPLICDPLSTVKRGEECVCRYEGMIRVNDGLCLCRSGLPPLGADGCG